MTPQHFIRVVQAEMVLVFTRWSGRMALILAVAIPTVITLVFWYFYQKVVEVDLVATGVSEFVSLSTAGVLKWTLVGRNFFFLPILLVLATAASVSGEIGDNTLRPLVWRPVPREGILGAKVLALLLLAICTLSVSLIVGFIGGAMVFGTAGGGDALSDLALGYLVSGLSDLGLIAMTACVGSFTGRVGRATVSLVVLLMIDKAAMLLLKGLSAVGVSDAEGKADYLPGNALECWKGWDPSVGWASQQFVGMGILLAFCFGVALLRFRRMDVP